MSSRAPPLDARPAAKNQVIRNSLGTFARFDLKTTCLALLKTSYYEPH